MLPQTWFVEKQARDATRIQQMPNGSISCVGLHEENSEVGGHLLSADWCALCSQQLARLIDLPLSFLCRKADAETFLLEHRPGSRGEGFIFQKQ